MHVYKTICSHYEYSYLKSYIAVCEYCYYQIASKTRLIDNTICTLHVAYSAQYEFIHSQRFGGDDKQRCDYFYFIR